MMDELISKIKSIAKADVSHWKTDKPVVRQKPQVKTEVLTGSTDKVIAIGASTGGTVALTQIINDLPPDIPGVVIVQHMPPVFTRMFADRLNETSRLTVQEAKSGDRIITGRVLIAPGGQHMEVIRSGGYYHVECKEGEKVNGHCPSVDVLFNSVARYAGSNALGIILTGMGKDGAEGLLNMKKNGARTFSQDESSSVVFGMPNEAFKNGGAEELVPLQKISSKMVQVINEMRK
jgi:two-component system chemotaxis response regulator CheB